MEVFCSEVMKNQVAFYLVTEPRYFSEHKEAVAGRCSLRKVFLEISQNSQENTCASLCFKKVAGLRPATLLKQRLWRRCFLVNFGKFPRKFFFHRTPPVAAFEHITVFKQKIKRA